MSACDKNKPTPGGNGGGEGSGPAETGGGTEVKPDETEPPKDEGPKTNADGLLLDYFDNYIPDTTSPFEGKVGIAGSGVFFDRLRVQIKNKEAFGNDLEDTQELNPNVYSVIGGSLSDWKVSDDTVKKDNKMLGYTGSDASVLTFGNAKWTAYNVIVSVEATENGTAELYFCMKDEKNYYRLTAGASAETGVKLVEVKDGTETVLGSYAMSVPVGDWFNLSADIDGDGIAVFVDGTELFHVGYKDAGKETYKGLFGIAQWNTEYYVDNVKVEDAEGNVLYEEDFEDGKFLDNAKFGLRNGGSWQLANTSDWEIIEVEGNHVLHYKNSGVYGSVALFDPNLPENATNLKFSYEGYRVGGSEGYACVWNWDESTMVESTGEGKDYVCLNIGGWSGQCGFQFITGGAKTNVQNNAAIGLNTAEWQKVELYLNPENMVAFFAGQLAQIYWY